MKLHFTKWALVVCLLLVAQTVGADFILAKFTDGIQSRGMMLYFTAWVILLAVPLLNRYLRVVAVYMLLFLLARGFSRITDEQDPVRVLYSMLPGVMLGIKIVVPLVAVVVLVKALEWVLRNMGLFSKTITPEEITDAFNNCLKNRKPSEEFRKRLATLGVKAKETQAWLRRYEERLAASNSAEETI